MVIWIWSITKVFAHDAHREHDHGHMSHVSLCELQLKDMELDIEFQLGIHVVFLYYWGLLYKKKNLNILYIGQFNLNIFNSANLILNLSTIFKYNHSGHNRWHWTLIVLHDTINAKQLAPALLIFAIFLKFSNFFLLFLFSSFFLFIFFFPISLHRSRALASTLAPTVLRNIVGIHVGNFQSKLARRAILANRQKD